MNIKHREEYEQPELITVVVPRYIKQAIRAESAREQRSMSNWVRQVLEERLNNAADAA